MNKAIAQSTDLMPPPFSDGLAVWSSQNGGPGSNNYANSNNAQVLFTDPDFEECLEIVTNKSPQKLRYTGQTPTPPGCYLRVSARVKVVSGIMPDFEIAAWPADSGGNYVSGLVEKGPRVAATEYDKIYEISAIYGSGGRPGVDCVWGLNPAYGHFGLNVVGGANGSSVRIESIRIEDVTSAYLRVMMDWVDVRDFGARGDGVFNNKSAFEAADAAAEGREVLVPTGDYFINGSITLNSRFRFEGRIVQDQSDRFNLLAGLRYGTYLDAFKDERIALEKALQTLINDNDHDGLDLEGRTVDVDRPIDVHAAVGNRSSFTARRTIRNGRIRAVDSPFWASIGVTRNANYVSGAKTLTGISSAGDIEVGAIVTGAGVGREIYVRSVNASAGEVTLSKPLFAAAANQNYAFVRHKYILDFAGFNFLSNFELSGVSLEGGGFASCLILPPDGFNWRIHNSWFMRPKDRGITSCGNGDFAMSIENCEFHSNEQDTANGNRTTIALNCNANDNRIRHCRGARFLHFAVLGGTNIMFQSNHIYQGSEGSSSRLAGVVFTETKINSTVSGNYIDNCWIEWSNEHAVNISSSSIFGSLTVNDNLFFASNVAEASFRFLYLKPFASGMGLVDLSVTDNTFRVSGGSINRAEGVLSDGGSLDPDRFKNIRFAGNGFEAVNTAAQNPLRVEYSLASGSASNAWFVNSNGQLPFNGPARNVDAVVATSEIRNGGGGGVTAMPWTQSQQGGGSLIRLNWPQAVHGSVAVTMRGDQPD